MRKVQIESANFTLKAFFKNRLIAILLSLVTFVIFWKSYSTVYTPTGSNLLAEWAIEKTTVPGLGRNLKIPYYRNYSKPMELLLSRDIEWHEGDILVLPKISGNRMRLLLNDHAIFQVGGPGGTGNIWSGFYWIRLPAYQSHGKLVVELFGQYDIGMGEIPYIIPEKGNSLFLFITNLLASGIYLVAVGSALVTALLLFFYSKVKSPLAVSFKLTAMGMVLGAVYTFEFSFRESSGSVAEYLLMKKILMMSGFTSSWLLAAGTEWYHFKKLRIPGSGILGVVTAVNLVLLAVPDNLYDLKQINYIAGALSMLNWIYIFILSYKNRNRIVLYTTGFLFVCIVYSFMNIVMMLSPVYFFQVAFVAAQIGISLNLLQEYFRLNEDFIDVHEKSIMDPLTGAYNRFVLDEMTAGPADIIVVVDINNFKNLNDRFGHEAGDLVLKEFVKIARENFRKDDMIIRTGGDEFVILLKDGNTEVMNRINRAFAGKMDKVNASFSWGSANVVSTIGEAINCADRKMFENKRSAGIDFMI